MSDDQSYWIRIHGKTEGPYSKQELRVWFAAGRLTGKTLLAPSPEGPWRLFVDGPPKTRRGAETVRQKRKPKGRGKWWIKDGHSRLAGPFSKSELPEMIEQHDLSGQILVGESDAGPWVPYPDFQARQAKRVLAKRAAQDRRAQRESLQRHDETIPTSSSRRPDGLFRKAHREISGDIGSVLRWIVFTLAVVIAVPAVAILGLAVVARLWPIVLTLVVWFLSRDSKPKWYGDMQCLDCEYKWISKRATSPSRCPSCSSRNIGQQLRS